jgi:hypothetical protein
MKKKLISLDVFDGLANVIVMTFLFFCLFKNYIIVGQGGGAL